MKIPGALLGTVAVLLGGHAFVPARAAGLAAPIPSGIQQSAPATTGDVASQPPSQAVAADATPATASVPANAPGHVIPASGTKKKGKKDEYTGPNTIVELPPTPMLDEEGKQRLDPDGKPLFNLPVKQQRDKKGHPLFDEAGKPVMQTATELGYDERGKKLHVQKVKPPKMLPVSISRGTLTVDGMTAKAALNYDIADLKYLYLFAPGVGVVVVSPEPFPGAIAQARAFNGKTLVVNVREHTLELGSDTRLLGKDPKPAYVLLDREFMLPSRSPVMGYGTTRKAPYVWPGAKPNAALAGVAAPPVPVSMLPTQLMSPCPAGQMRRPAPAALPGQPAPAQPCVPVSSIKASPAASGGASPASAKP